MAAKKKNYEGKSVNLLRENGWPADLCGGRYGKFDHDLFNIFDVVALVAEVTVGIQVTTVGHKAERIAKMRLSPYLAAWLESPTRLAVLHCWREHADGNPTCEAYLIDERHERRLEYPWPEESDV